MHDATSLPACGMQHVSTEKVNLLESTIPSSVLSSIVQQALNDRCVYTNNHSSVYAHMTIS